MIHGSEWDVVSDTITQRGLDKAGGNVSHSIPAGQLAPDIAGATKSPASRQRSSPEAGYSLVTGRRITDWRFVKRGLQFRIFSSTDWDANTRRRYPYPRASYRK